MKGFSISVFSFFVRVIIWLCCLFYIVYAHWSKMIQSIKLWMLIQKGIQVRFNIYFCTFYRNSWMKCFGSCLPCLRRPNVTCQNVRVRLPGPLPMISWWSLSKAPWKTTCFCIKGCFNSTQRVGHSSQSW